MYVYVFIYLVCTSSARPPPFCPAGRAAARLGSALPRPTGGPRSPVLPIACFSEHDTHHSTRHNVFE